MSPPEGLGDILFFPGRPSVRLSVHLSVRHESCPLCNLKTPEAIFTKLHTNVNQHKTTCRVQERLLLQLYFFSYFPLNFVPQKIVSPSCPLYNF